MKGSRQSGSLRAAIILAMGMGLSSIAAAVGLGPIQINSYLGQPLNASIRLSGLSDSDLKNTQVKLANDAAYQARGVPRTSEQGNLRFQIVKSGSGHRIMVTTATQVREPIINFILSMNNGGQVINREYAVFLDPDPTAQAGIRPIATPTSVPAATTVQESMATANNDILDGNAQRIELSGQTATSTTSLPTAVAVPSKPAPVATQKTTVTPPPVIPSAAASTSAIQPASRDTRGWGGIDAQSKRVVLDGQQTASASQEMAARTPSVTRNPVNTNAAPVPTSHYTGSGAYGPVKPGETLYSIAAATRPSASVSMDRWMRAIFNTNRGAFSRNDLNSLMAGVRLVIPDGNAALAGVSAPSSRENKPTGQSASEQTSSAEAMNDQNKPSPVDAQESGENPDETVMAQESAGEGPTINTEVSTQGEEVVPALMDDAQTALAEEIASSEPETGSEPAPGLQLEGVDSIGQMVTQESDNPVMTTPETTPPDSSMPATDSEAQPPVMTGEEAVKAAVKEEPAKPEMTAPFGLQWWQIAVAGVGALLLIFLLLTKLRKKPAEGEFSEEEVNRMVSDMEHSDQFAHFTEKDSDAVNLSQEEVASLDLASLEATDAEQFVVDLEKDSQMFEADKMTEANTEEDAVSDSIAEIDEDFFAENTTSAALAGGLGVQDDDSLDFFEENTPKIADEVTKDRLSSPSDDDLYDSLDLFADAEPAHEDEALEAEIPQESTSEIDSDAEDDLAFFDAEMGADDHDEMEELLEDDFFSDSAETVSDKLDPTPVQAAAASAPREAKPVKAAEPQSSASAQATKKPAAHHATVTRADEQAMDINLDLAVTYIKSGVKPEKARLWLNEVLTKGTTAQRKLAQELLNKLG